MSKYLYLLSKNQFKVLFFLFVIIILYLESLPQYFEHFDKVKHIIVFFLLSFLLNRSSKTSKRIRNMIVLFMFGVFVEFIQRYLPDRQVSRADILANLIGILLFQITYSILKFWQKKRREKA